MKIGVIIQARMGSTRLPEKVMKYIQGKTVLAHVIDRVKQSKLIDEIIIATTTKKCDSQIEIEANKCGVKVFRGSEDDVLSRYYFASKKHGLDVIIRITSDCPLIDPIVLDKILFFFLNNEYDIVSNAGSESSSRTYPRGLDVEVFSYDSLATAFAYAVKNYQREHVTPYIYENANQVHYYKNNSDYSKYRWTLDTCEDFELISEIYRYLYHGIHDFYLDDIIKLFEEKPLLFEINGHIEQKSHIAGKDDNES